MTASVDPIPAGYEGVIPHLIVKGAAAACDFYAKAFGAEVTKKHPAPGDDRIMHAEIRIDGRPVFLNDDFPEFSGGQERSPAALGACTCTIHRFVTDCDAAVKQAEAAGATVIMAPADMFWGDRYAMVTDPFGHHWSLATRIADPSQEEMDAAAKAAFAG